MVTWVVMFLLSLTMDFCVLLVLKLSGHSPLWIVMDQGGFSGDAAFFQGGFVNILRSFPLSCNRSQNCVCFRSRWGRPNGALKMITASILRMLTWKEKLALVCLSFKWIQHTGCKLFNMGKNLQPPSPLYFEIWNGSSELGQRLGSFQTWL